MSRPEPFVVRWAREVASQHDDIGWTQAGDAAQEALRQASEAQRARTNARHLRLSPNVLGLSLVKRAILGAYRWRIISLGRAQRLVDLSKSWEA